MDSYIERTKLAKLLVLREDVAQPTCVLQAKCNLGAMVRFSDIRQKC